MENDKSEPYGELCDLIEDKGGKIRLGRTGEGFMLVVDAPPLKVGHRVAGYAFRDLSDLDLHAELILQWLREIVHRPDTARA